MINLKVGKSFTKIWSRKDEDRRCIKVVINLLLILISYKNLLDKKYIV